MSEPIDRTADRREEDRRTGSRPFRFLFVRSSAAPLPIQYEASLSLQGVTWKTEYVPPEDTVELHLQLPDLPRESIIPGRIERRRPLEDGLTELYASFLALDLNTELALARFIESRTQLAAVFASEARPEGR